MKFTDIKFERHPIAIGFESEEIKGAMDRVEGYEEVKRGFDKWETTVIAKVETKAGTLSIVGGGNAGSPFYCDEGTYEIMLPKSKDVEGWKTPEEIEEIIKELNKQ